MSMEKSRIAGQRPTDCEECNDTGKVRCLECGGKGHGDCIWCGVCMGDGVVNCESCNPEKIYTGPVTGFKVIVDETRSIL